MSVTSPTPPASRGAVRRLLATRRGTLALAGLCSLVAAAVLMAFLTRYRDSLAADAKPTPVLVAKALIEKGTSGDLLAEERLFESVERAARDVKEGAIADPALIAGKVTAADIYPGQQITAESFTAAPTTVLPKLSGDQRAIAVPIDHAHGLVGQVESGDHVDVLASYGSSNEATGQSQGIVKTVLQDALVLRAGAQPIEGGNEGKEAEKSIVLRATDREAVMLAHVADNGKVWVVLRPAAGAEQSKLQSATRESVLRGTAKSRTPGFKTTIKKVDEDTITVTGKATP